MGLIACPACSKEVSDAAASCPNCGHPIGSPTDSTRSERTVTTQATGKMAKKHAFAGGVTVVIGLLLSGQNSEVAAYVVMLGIGWWLAARVYAWWHYG